MFVDYINAESVWQHLVIAHVSLQTFYIYIYVDLCSSFVQKI